ncbi:MAG: hypothetical protein ACFFDP_01070 [Promethearchaeota archaeon]
MRIQLWLAKHGFKLTTILVAVAVCSLLLGSVVVRAQGSEYFQNDDMKAQIVVNGVSLKAANVPSNAIPINISEPVVFEFTYNVTSPTDVRLVRLELTVFFTDVAIFTYPVTEPYGPGGLLVPAGSSNSTTGVLDLQPLLEMAGIQLATGVYRISANLFYHLEGSTEERAIGTDFPTPSPVYFRILGNPLLSAVGVAAVAGAAIVGVSTASSIIGFIGSGSAISQISQLANLGSGSFGDWTELVKTGWRMRSIRKKAKDLLALPNLAVLAGTAILAGLAGAVAGHAVAEATMDEKEKKMILDGVRERALAAWAGVRCPRCDAKWTEPETPCPKGKCGIDWETGRKEFADKMVELAEKALPIIAKKETLDVRSLAKKLKTSDYYAGLLGTMLTDLGATKIAKVKTPMKSLAINGASIALVTLTWTQLLGYTAMGLIGWIAIISAGATICFFIALTISRIAQGKRIQKLQEERTAKQKAKRKTKADEKQPSPKTETTESSEEADESEESVDAA